MVSMSRFGVLTPLLDFFWYAPAAKSLQCLRARMLVAVLRIIDRKTHDAANFVRKSPEVIT